MRRLALLAAPLALALSACAGGGGLGGSVVKISSEPVDGSYARRGQRFQSGTTIVHYHKAKKMGGKLVVCIGTVLENRQNFFADGLESQLMRLTKLKVDDRTVFNGLTGRSPITRVDALRRPDKADCYDTGTAWTGPARSSIEVPGYVRVVE